MSYLISILSYEKFFEKWFLYTKETSTTAFTSNNPKALSHYGQAINLLEHALYLCGNKVCTAKLISQGEFREMTDPLIKAHTKHIDMGVFLLAMKFFRQSLLDVAAESDAENKESLMFNLGKVFDAIDLIIAEIYYINGTSQLKNRLYELANAKTESKFNLKPLPGTLTKTERLICELVASGFSTKEIASRMNVAESTVQTHRKNIRRKFSLTGKQNLYSHLMCLEIG